MKSDRPFASAGLIWFLTGLLAVAVGFIPYIILGSQCIFTIPDQLDGEIVAYYLNSLHFGDGVSAFEEVMGGVPVTAFVAPSPFSVLFFRVFPLLDAFLINHFFVLLVAFIGMYFFCDKAGVHPFISFCCSVLFSYLPFYTVYGLSIAGLPLVMWAWLILKEKNFKGCAGWVLLILYSAASSPVLVGYAVCFTWAVLLVIRIIRTRKVSETLAAWTGLALMALTYLVLNHRLFSEVLFGGEVSNKDAYVKFSTPFAESFREMLMEGNMAAKSVHTPVFWAAALVMLVGAFLIKRMNEKQLKGYRALVCFFIGAVLIAFFYAFAQSPFFTAVRNENGGLLRSFQF